MVDTIIVLRKTSLQAMADEAHEHELGRKLKDLGTDGGKNFAVYEDPTRTPKKDIAILASPAVGPTGAKKLFSGRLTVGPNPIDVDCFRVA